MDGRQDVPAYFTSDYRFSESEYIQLKGFFAFHPLQLIYNYIGKTKNKEFTPSDVALATKQKENTIKTSFFALQNKGFLKFNSYNGTYSLTEKATHYYKSRLEKSDYDIISVKSLAKTVPADPSKEPIVSLPNNAVLQLDSNKLVVFGVDKVVLSDSNDVSFVPKDRKVTFLEDRNMEFDGTLTTSNYIFNGRDFKFNYELFNVDLINIDSIEFSIDVFDSISGKMVKEKMDNKLSYSKGTLTIDETTNKSGLKRNPRYPHFDANHGASVLFNKKEILNGVYDSTFRYLIPPFAVDSLSGDMESNVSFDGEFLSGGVFPPIKQKLEVMPDRGFGFIHECPKEGYPIFDGLARFYGTVSMGNNGLRGDGKIVFLNTTLESMDFVFYKDSVSGLGDVAITKGGKNAKTGDVTFPACEVTDYEMMWYVSKDSMIITNYDNAFKLYDNQVDLSGQMVITTKGMKGAGLVETNGSLTISKNFLFKEKSFNATKGQFEILTKEVGKPALRSDYVNVDFDLAKKQAWFSPAEEGYASNNFPFLKYKTSLNDGFWDIEKKIVTLEKPYEMDIKDSYFISTKKSQDSLAFNAEKAIYFIDSLKLKIEGVEKISIADALVYPKDRQIDIQENAKISTLKEAMIIMDTVHEYHTLINGVVDINSRTDLDGHADYRYVNFQEDTIPIKFSDFKLEAMKNVKGIIEYHTVARGTILEEDTFMVAPQMLFKGEVTMLAHKRLLSMDGYIKLDLHGTLDTPNWMRYENSEDVDAIRIDLESQENKNNVDLVNGLHYSFVNNDYYSTFLSKKQDDNDQTIIQSSGFLVHDIETKEFEVVNKNRLMAHEFSGNVFGYVEADEKYDMNGRFALINPVPDIAHHFTFDFAGQGTNSIIDSSFALQGLASLKFEIDPKIYDLIGAKYLEIQKYLPASKTVKIGDSLFYNLGNLTTHKEALKYKEATKSDYQPLNKNFKFFEEGFTFNNLNLVWDRENHTWHNYGMTGLANVGNQDLNMVVKAFVEIKKTPEEDHVNLYLELTPDIWYHFLYSANALFIQTSDPAVEQFVQSKNTQAKNMPRGVYYWAFGEEEDLTRFKTHYIADYLGGKDIEIDYSNLNQINNKNDEFEDEFEKKEEPKKEEVKDTFEEEFDEEVQKDTASTEQEKPTEDEFEEATPKKEPKAEDKKDKNKKDKKSTKTEEEKPKEEEKVEEESFETEETIKEEHTEGEEQKEETEETEDDEFGEDTGN
jgi:hypothetical protein